MAAIVQPALATSITAVKRVFVSYSRNNLDAVTPLIEDLQAVGIDAWYDQTLTGGQRWWENILAKIRECDIFVFALSPESWESDACKSELSYVLQLGKTILPVLVADGINLNLVPPPLNEFQVTDYRRRDKGASFALVKSVNTAPPTAPLVDPLPTPPAVPVSYLSSLKERIDSTDPLTSQDQIKLIFELEVGLREGRSRTEIRDLLLSLRRRDDLLAKVGTRIDEALNELGDKLPVRLEEKRPPESPTGMHPPKDRTADDPPPPEGSKRRRYACAPSDTSRLIEDVKHWLDAQGFDSQQMHTESQGHVIQIKRRGAWRDFVGMSTSLNIVFRQSGDTLTVEIGAGKWIDKAAAGTVSMFILWPLAITAGFGAWEQMKMPEKIFDYIGSQLIYK